jgi:membrane associated rhomboid family serine protease
MFLLIPTGVSYRTDRFPVITFGIMGLNVVIYLISLGCTLANGEAAEEWILTNLWLTPATASWYQYFTAMFVHAGFLHLLGNMIYLFLFGSSVEDAIGRWKYVVFYLLGGLAADFLHIAGSAEHFASEVPMGGASGAISACMGGFLLLFHKTKINFRYILFIFFRFWSGDFELPSWLVVSFWFLKDLAFAILSYGSGGGGVAFAAHSGGFIAGLGLVAANKLLQRRGISVADEKQEVIKLRPQIVELPSIYIFDSGSQAGPFTRAQILQMQKLGSLSVEAVFWQDGMPEWRSIAEVGDSL